MAKRYYWLKLSEDFFSGVWTLSAYYKKSRIEKGNSRELGERFCRNFILAIPKALKA